MACTACPQLYVSAKRILFVSTNSFPASRLVSIDLLPHTLHRFSYRKLQQAHLRMTRAQTASPNGNDWDSSTTIGLIALFLAIPGSIVALATLWIVLSQNPTSIRGQYFRSKTSSYSIVWPIIARVLTASWSARDYSLSVTFTHVCTGNNIEVRAELTCGFRDASSFPVDPKRRLPEANGDAQLLTITSNRMPKTIGSSKSPTATASPRGGNYQ
jgi:hypothetical protein